MFDMIFYKFMRFVVVVVIFFVCVGIIVVFFSFYDIQIVREGAVGADSAPQPRSELTERDILLNGLENFNRLVP